MANIPSLPTNRSPRLGAAVYFRRLPVGLMLRNRLPEVMTMTLKPFTLQTSVVTMPNGQFMVRQGSRPQLNFIVRAVYFAQVGWWLSGAWLLAAWTIAGFKFGLGLPMAF